MADDKITTTPFASAAFAFSWVESAFETALDTLIGETEGFERLGWDEYDNSLELHECTPGLRLSAEAAQYIWDNGFSICYVNHTDGWETHYLSSRGIDNPWRTNRRQA